MLVSGLSLFSAPDAVTEKLAQLSDIGADRVMMLHNFRLIPQSVVLESIHTLVRDVPPRAGITALAA